MLEPGRKPGDAAAMTIHRERPGCPETAGLVRVVQAIAETVGQVISSELADRA